MFAGQSYDTLTEFIFNAILPERSVPRADAATLLRLPLLPLIARRPRTLARPARARQDAGSPDPPQLLHRHRSPPRRCVLCCVFDLRAWELTFHQPRSPVRL